LIGITTTIPVEIVFAAGQKPIDLNNLFITSSSPVNLIDQAELSGFAPSICSWIKGIYSTVINHDIKKVIAVTGGDCSNTIAMSELLENKGVEIIPFQYPFERKRESLLFQMDKLREKLNTTWMAIEKTKNRLGKIRKKLRKIDELTYRENIVTGMENHLFMVSSSDFNGDPDAFDHKLDQFLIDISQRTPFKEKVRLGYLGVPPIFNQFYEFIESKGSRIVFNEVQRQFSMPFDCHDIIDLYLAYTYPYDIHGRIQDIKKAIRERELDGLIHYTQTFCFRQLYDTLLKEKLGIPILTLEGDRPGCIDSRTGLRIETFIEMLSS